MQDISWPIKRGSSPVDWCEGNYLISPTIAEFFNTISNVFYIIFPPLLTTLFREYAECINRGVYLVWGLLMFVGLSSVYFHSTLSLVGQLLDEVAILWLVMACFALWLPRRYYTFGFKNRENYQLFMVISCCGGTVLTLVDPILNAFFLMCFTIPSIALLIAEMRGCHDRRVVRLGYRVTILWLTSVVCWINDRLLCEVWSYLNFPYLHGAWHILSAISGYGACVLFAYFYACDSAAQQLPEMRFWPSDRFELGVPYVAFRNARKRH